MRLAYCFMLVVGIAIVSCNLGLSIVNRAPAQVTVKVEPEIRVMVIDTGIGVHPKLKPYVQYNESDDYVDNHGHGTHVTGIVLYGNKELNDPVCENVKVFACKTKDMNASSECLKKALELKIDYINYSGGGIGWSFTEYNLFKEFEKRGGVTFAAAGNEKKEITDQTPYFPAMYRFGMKFLASDGKWKRAKGLKSIYVVESVCGKEVCEYSNHHPMAFQENGEFVYSTLPRGGFGYMKGTSQAAPALLHLTLKQHCNDLKVGVQSSSK